jgi:hypothetical protein
MTNPQRSSPVTLPVASTPLHSPSAPAVQDIKCEDYLPDFICHPHVPELPDASDIPWWVWAIGGAGVVGFATLTYVSFKAAPYVLPVVSPEHAPLAKAWLRARAGHDKYEIAHDALQALREQRARTTPRTREEIMLLREEALKEAFADILARRRLKQLAKGG